MTGADFQMKLDAIVADLQTSGKGQTVQVLFRAANNQPTVFPLSSSPTGIVDAEQLRAIQAFTDVLKPLADKYELERAPVTAALDTFNAQRLTHQRAIEAATAARVALNDELLADADYQEFSRILEAARIAPEYVEAAAIYNSNNVSENYSELTAAKGKYIV